MLVSHKSTIKLSTWAMPPKQNSSINKPKPEKPYDPSLHDPQLALVQSSLPSSSSSFSVNIPPSGHDQNAKGIRQMQSYFDYQQWASQAGSHHSGQTVRQQRHALLSREEIQVLKKRRNEVKKKHKYGWLYKDSK